MLDLSVLLLIPSLILPSIAAWAASIFEMAFDGSFPLFSASWRGRDSYALAKQAMPYWSMPGHCSAYVKFRIWHWFQFNIWTNFHLGCLFYSYLLIQPLAQLDLSGTRTRHHSLVLGEQFKVVHRIIDAPLQIVEHIVCATAQHNSAEATVGALERDDARVTDFLDLILCLVISRT